MSLTPCSKSPLIIDSSISDFSSISLTRGCTFSRANRDTGGQTQYVRVHNVLTLLYSQSGPRDYETDIIFSDYNSILYCNLCDKTSCDPQLMITHGELLVTISYQSCSILVKFTSLFFRRQKQAVSCLHSYSYCSEGLGQPWLLCTAQLASTNISLAMP